MKFSEDQMSQIVEVLNKALDQKLGPVVATMNQRFTAIDQKFTSVDKNFAGIDQKFTAIDARFTSIDQKLDSMQKDIKHLKRDTTYLRTTANLIIESFEKADERISKRVEIIERSL